MSYPPQSTQPGHSTQVSARRARNGVGVAAVAIGSLALFCAAIPPITSLGGMLGLVAVIVGIVAITRVALRKATNMVASMAGFGMGLTAFAVATVLAQLGL